ncbi:Transcriptional regulator, contains XRE-family HTH domain [Malonomonas rubra DSM 5091]|uniref:Transcriptional regulator, contains XRE-family HTH domain n=1 Tax=Malonomonas rubra DSM 5091 TaxID=1122189 RepID=A0A1M6L5B6_MALRU|nr:helix-turn-helix domain-containing protein [Malonomonas rubra]SHJ66360.1 Transcriptional regulator, contains XRE-family HTH domain [Malonomonas rubra DSM 5091]
MQRTIGQKLRKIREEAGLTQKAFAEKLGTNPVQMNRLENQDGSHKTMRLPDAKILVRLRELFGVDLNWLICDDESVPLRDVGTLPLLDEAQLILPSEDRKTTVQLNLPGGEGGDFFYRVRDEGMVPLVRTGDHVVVQCVEPKSGDLALILTQRGIVQVRRLSQTDNGMMLCPENSDYGQAFSASEAKLLGRVIRVLRSFSV